mmetsp:Transcript_10464/g.24994  ORF Transcript_10464/g.24994 Transcript_10464/m.24994 type:complete len:113 (+) Transcript_10464:339-677(+)
MCGSDPGYMYYCDTELRTPTLFIGNFEPPTLQQQHIRTPFQARRWSSPWRLEHHSHGDHHANQNRGASTHDCHPQGMRNQGEIHFWSTRVDARAMYDEDHRRRTEATRGEEA